MFKVVDGSVKVVESVFANKNREAGQVLEDIAVKVPDSDDKNHFASNGQVPMDRVLPAAGFT